MLFEKKDFEKQSSLFSDAMYLSLSIKSLIREFDKDSQEEDKNEVFLSHKHSDLPFIHDILKYIGEHANIYIDSMDSEMTGSTSPDTAEKIKKVIQRAERFLLIATEDAIKSYWCNWELGIGDVLKHAEGRLAIFPIKENGASEEEYIGHEYLGIYPHVIKVLKPGTLNRYEYRIHNPHEVNNSTDELLSEWLK